MSKAEITKGINYYDFLWADEQIRIRVSRIIETGARGMQADILISTTADLPATHIHQSTLGLFSLSARNELERTLKRRMPDTDWQTIIEQFCVLAPRYHRQGEDAETIYTMDESVKPPNELIKPLILENEINMIFGEGGSGKSYLALLIALCFIGALKNNPLGLEMAYGVKDRNVLLLDWETYKGGIQWRWKLVANGLGLDAENFGLEYRRCQIPLVDDLEQIQKIIKERKISLVMVDSVAMASGADINAPDTAIRFMNAVRQLGCAVLLIHHTSKDQLGRKTPYGSVFFKNASRSIWEIKAVQNPTEHKTTIGLWHDKHNYTIKYDPIGAEMLFISNPDNPKLIDAVKFQSIDIADVPEFSDRAPIITRIIRTIEDSGAKTHKELANVLNVPPSQVLYILKGNGDKFVELKGFNKADDSNWDLAH